MVIRPPTTTCVFLTPVFCCPLLHMDVHCNLQRCCQPPHPLHTVMPTVAGSGAGPGSPASCTLSLWGHAIGRGPSHSERPAQCHFTGVCFGFGSSSLIAVLAAHHRLLLLEAHHRLLFLAADHRLLFLLLSPLLPFLLLSSSFAILVVICFRCCWHHFAVVVHVAHCRWGCLAVTTGLALTAPSTESAASATATARSWV